MGGGSGIFSKMGAGCRGGGGGESGGAGGGCWERCELNRSSRERCFCSMLLGGEEGGEGCGEGEGGLTSGGGGTHCFCKAEEMKK